MEDAALASQSMGEGKFPAALGRVNWAAFLLGWLWVLGHGLWAWFAALVAAGFLSSVLLAFMSGTVARFFANPDFLAIASSGPLTVALRVLMTATSWLVPAFFAVRGNRMIWVRDAATIGRRATRSVESYIAAERRLVAVGGLVFAFGVVYGYYVAIQTGTVSSTLLSHAFGLVVFASLLAWDMTRRRESSRRTS